MLCTHKAFPKRSRYPTPQRSHLRARLDYLCGSERPARGVAYVRTHTIANDGPNADICDRDTLWGADNGPHNGQSMMDGARGNEWPERREGEYRRQAAA